MSADEYRKHWIERVRSRCFVDANGCWLWERFCGHNGYGMTTYRGIGNVILHRQMYKAWHQVSLGHRQNVCHSCDVKRCCNPAHLWIGNQQDNMLDHSAKGRNKRLSRNHCFHGHEYTPENTRIVFTKAGGPVRQCKTCQRIRHRMKTLGWTMQQAVTLPVSAPGQRPVAGRGQR